MPHLAGESPEPQLGDTAHSQGLRLPRKPCSSPASQESLLGHRSHPRVSQTTSPCSAGAWLPPTQADHCHHLPPHSVLGRIKELSLTTTLNCVNERVRRGEVGKRKMMACGDKAPLLGARREVASLNSRRPLIRQRPFCNYGGFPPPPPAGTQTERRDVSVAPKSRGIALGCTSQADEPLFVAGMGHQGIPCPSHSSCR